MSDIVPFYFNTLNMSRLKKIKNDNYDPNLFKVTMLNKENLRAQNHSILDTNSLGSGGANTTTGCDAYNTFDEYDSLGSIITKNKPEEPMKPHNNMQPFFGGALKQSTVTHNRMVDGKLEAHSGNFKLDATHKHEVPTLFSPVKQDIYQLDVPQQKDRYETALTYRNNELPFEQERVGRGINGGYNSTPSGGFHNQVRILPKNIDQLLVNPKETYEGRVITGNHYVGKRIATQKVTKNIEEFTPRGQVGNAKAMAGATNRADIIMNDPNRGRCETETMGNAYYGKGQTNVSTQQVQLNKDTTLLNVIRNLVNTIANIGTREESYTNNSTRGTNETQTTGNIIGPNQSYIKNNMPSKTTGRELIEHNNKNGSIMQQNKGIVTPTDVSKTTGRELIEHNNKNGSIMQQNKGIVYDPFDVSKTTGRQLIEHNDKNGSIMQQNKGIVSPTDVSKTTGRQLIEHNNKNGSIMQQNKGIVSPTDVSKTTGRQLIENNLHNGNINGNSIENGTGYMTNPVELIKTQREDFANNNYNAPAGKVVTSHAVYDNMYNMRQNVVNEQLSVNRENAKQGSKVFNANIGHVNMPNDIQENIRDNTKFMSKSDRLNSTFKMKEPVAENKFFDTAILDQLKYNPFNLDVTVNL
jgi:hypothetical protein